MRVLVISASVALVLSGCSPSPSDMAPSSPSTSSVPTPEELAARISALPAPYNEADLADGIKQFNKCRSCHTISPEKMDLTGPHLYGVFGRKSGTVEGYTFTEAMTAHNVVWDYATLDEFIRAPQSTVKGTKMGYMGIKDDTERRDLIAYLKIMGPQEAAPVISGGASEVAP